MAAIRGEAYFSVGAEVEVRSPVGYFIPATIIARGSSATSFLVEYKTLKTKTSIDKNKGKPSTEELDVSLMRPSPPKENNCTYFKAGQEVDAYYKGSWWEGLVTEVFEDSSYFFVCLNGNHEVELEISNLRPHRDWVDGQWVPPLNVKFVNKQNVAVSNGGQRMEEFEIGSLVEIRNEEEGFEGSWYTASIVKSVDNEKYCVQYKTIRTETGEKFLCEEVDRRNIRPYPPEIIRVDSFGLNEEVDAYYNDGWWEGVICKVLSRGRYRVYFKSSDEEILFEHEELRLHQNWINHTWVWNSK
ncbi:protein AGENET DOMAIN (AGD)-CONTAINING P1-like isoform X2 [Humulus lupulus]|nr:protein AGENET DOMAIN (AGD)-CONTAINING P1-like isoform X2 [Humulus lupulus]